MNHHDRIPTNRTRLAVLALLASLAASSVGALSFDRVAGFEEIAQTAELAVRGQVLGLEHRSIEAGSRSFPYTEVEILVETCFAGCEGAGETVILRQMGGALPNGLHVTVPGLAGFRLGGRYLVFASESLHAVYGTLWGARGAFLVVDGEPGERLVLNAHGRPLEIDSAGRFRPSAELRCLGLEAGGTRCARWVEGEADHEADFDAEGRELADAGDLQPVRLEDLESYLHELRAASGTPSAPYRGDRATFEAALVRTLGAGR